MSSKIEKQGSFNALPPELVYDIAFEVIYPTLHREWMEHTTEPVDYSDIFSLLSLSYHIRDATLLVLADILNIPRKELDDSAAPPVSHVQRVRRACHYAEHMTPDHPIQVDDAGPFAEGALGSLYLTLNYLQANTLMSENINGYDDFTNWCNTSESTLQQKLAAVQPSLLHPLLLDEVQVRLKKVHEVRENHGTFLELVRLLNALNDDVASRQTPLKAADKTKQYMAVIKKAKEKFVAWTLASLRGDRHALRCVRHNQKILAAVTRGLEERVKGETASGITLDDLFRGLEVVGTSSQ